MRPVTLAVCCTLGLLVCACKPQKRDGLSVSNAYAYAPLTSATPGVAYFTLSNQGAAAFTVHGFASDCFARTELHASTLDSGMAKMQPVDSLHIESSRSVALQPGGLHLMLISPKENVGPGTVCKLLVKIAGGEELETSVELLDRTVYRPAEPVK